MRVLLAEDPLWHPRKPARPLSSSSSPGARDGRAHPPQGAYPFDGGGGPVARMVPEETISTEGASRVGARRIVRLSW